MRLPSSLFRPDPLAQQSYLENYSPSFTQMAGRAFDDSFGTSSLGLVESITEMQQAESTGMPLVEEEWRASGDYRPGLEYKNQSIPCPNKGKHFARGTIPCEIGKY